MNSIYVLLSPTGEKIATSPKIVKHIIRYYTSLFGITRDTIPVNLSLVDVAWKVTPDMNLQLTEHLTMQELKQAILWHGE